MDHYITVEESSCHKYVIFKTSMWMIRWFIPDDISRHVENIQSIANGLRSGIVYQYKYSCPGGISIDIRESSPDVSYPHARIDGSMWYPLKTTATQREFADALGEYVNICTRITEKAASPTVLVSRWSGVSVKRYADYPKYEIAVVEPGKFNLRVADGVWGSNENSVNLTADNIRELASATSDVGLYTTIKLNNGLENVSIKVYSHKFTKLVTDAKSLVSAVSSTKPSPDTEPGPEEMSAWGVPSLVTDKRYQQFVSTFPAVERILMCYRYYGHGHTLEEYEEKLHHWGSYHTTRLAYYVHVVKCGSEVPGTPSIDTID